MVNLPFEILSKIFKHLSDTDLLQCQLVNKQYYEASVELIYSSIALEWYQPNFFIRTISTSPSLANYIKTIDVQWHLSKTERYKIWDRSSLLGALLHYCPNIQELRATDLGKEVWIRLMYAAKEGQLARLRSLSIARVAEIDYYIYTVLFFKNSLTTLLLCDADDTMITSQWSTLTTYQLVLDHIDQFPNLQHLSIGLHTDQPFYDFDRLIESCQGLKSFSVRLYPITRQVQKSTLGKFISKHPNINKLVCNWEMIKSDNQLKYIIYKLPNLQDLNILYDPYLDSRFSRETQPISCNTITEFFRYTLNIPTLEFGLQLEKLDLINVYTEFMKTNQNFKRLTISYIANYRDSNRITMRFKKAEPTLGFGLKSNDTTLPHLEFLSKSGHLIQSLTVESIWETLGMLSRLSDIYYILSRHNWIQNILEACPHLQELIFCNPLFLSLSYNLYFQHMNLKSFGFSIFEPSMSLDFLQSLSYNLPNLKQLHFGYGEWFGTDDTYHVIIKMPYTYFDLITCSDILLENELQYYIALQTQTQQSFFVVKQNELISINEICFNNATKQLSFHIICLKLNEFRVLWGDENDNTRCRTHRWIF